VQEACSKRCHKWGQLGPGTTRKTSSQQNAKEGVEKKTRSSHDMMFAEMRSTERGEIQKSAFLRVFKLLFQGRRKGEGWLGERQRLNAQKDRAHIWLHVRWVMCGDTGDRGGTYRGNLFPGKRNIP